MATSSSTGGGQHHASLNLMACVRESSPQQEDLVVDTIDADINRHDPSNKKRRFHPFRGLRRIFRKKVRHQHPGTSELQDPEVVQNHGMLEAGTPVQALDAHRSRSTSTLLSGDESCPRRRSGNGLFPCHSGLSVSHDSVFTAEHRTPQSSSEDLDTAQSSSSLSIQQLVLPGVQFDDSPQSPTDSDKDIEQEDSDAELFDALRRRGRRGDCTSEDDEDLGLPHSPCNSPTTADVLLEKGIKENPTKSHSTCSDGSLLSMGSSEMDEDSLCQHSGHSSKLSLHDKRNYFENDLELDLGVSAAPLSHSAARHKMAVRPKRTHGAPRRKRIQQLAGASPLPSTPELNEETSVRSASPDVRPTKNQDFIASDELCITTATTDITSDEVTTAWPSDDGLKSVANSLPAETQLKSASLPPGLALTQEKSNAELPAAAKVKRCNSSIAQRQSELATAAMHHIQRSMSEEEYSHSAKHQSRTIMSTETTITKSFVKSGVQTDTQRTFGTVGEEDEYIKDEDSNEDTLQKEKDKDEKKKDDSSFFSRLIRRSGKKKKEISQDTTDSLTISSSNSNKVISDMSSVVPKRIDMKGRYANETINDFSVNLPPTQHYPPPKQHTGKFGGSRSTPASRQRVMPINIPASPECQRKAETNREVEEVTVGLPLPTSPSPPAPEPETSGKSTQGPIPANRMQISYSTSPPKSLWQESNSVIYNSRPQESPFHAMNKTNSSSEPISPWRDGLEQRIIDNSARTHDREHGIEVQHFRSKLRVTGLSSYQQRVNNVVDLRCDEREYTSLIDTVSNEDSAEAVAARQNAVKKSKSFRREVDIPHLSHNVSAFSGETEAEPLKLSKDITSQNCEDKQTKSPKSLKSDSDISQESSHTYSIIEESTEQKEDEKTETSSDVHGRLFAKNSVISARSVVKEMSNATENSPVARSYNSRHPDRMMKKSSSLDSIGSFGDSKKSPTSDHHMSSKKSSSSESINSFTQQVTVPVYAEAISITHSMKKETKEEIIIREEKKILSTVSSVEGNSVPTSQSSQVKITEKINSPEVPKPVSPVTLSAKPPLPDSSKTVDIIPKSCDPSTRSSNQILDRNVNKVSSEKLEQSQVPTPQRVQVPRIRSLGSSSSTEQVPEFLKVQLNRVDNKPVTTSMVFDSTERSYSPLKSSEIRQTGLKRKESLGKLIEKSDTIETALNSTELPSQNSVIRERKPSRDDLITGANTVYSSQTEINTSKAVDSSVIVTEEMSKDPSIKISENEAPGELTTESQKQRCKSLPSSNQMNGSNRNYSVVSISSGITSTVNSSSKPTLKKQAMSLDSADSRKAFMKKQVSNDSDDIMIIEKTGMQEVFHNTSNVDNSGLKKKFNTKEHGSWKDDDSVSSEKSESGTIEIVLRSKKIISSKDFCIKKDEDMHNMEKRVSGESVESRKLGHWREDDSQKEKQTIAGENSSNQETNNSGSAEVVLRKKSLSRGEVNRGGSKDEEPELLKVFARRSLKLKDNECEQLGQQVATKSRNELASEQQATKSRDSDKENEGGDSPREERKKQMIKEPLAESKIHIESSEPPPVLKTSSTGISLANTPRNGSIVTGSNKYTRSLSSGVTLNNENATHVNESSLIYRKENPGLSPDKRQRNRTIPETPKTDTSLEKTPHRAWANIYREKEADITNSDSKKSNMDKQGETNDDNSIPRFKRIQQMKEEWELRAQQGLKKTLP